MQFVSLENKEDTNYDIAHCLKRFFWFSALFRYDTFSVIKK
jgi:hypothetical protein